MNHIKQFNEGLTQTLDVCVVDFKGGGDGIEAIYINGELHHYGDYYHDKISDWIKGFIEGLKYTVTSMGVTGISLNISEKECSDKDMIESTSEGGSEPPKLLSDVK